VLTPAKAGVFFAENFSRHNRGRLAKRPGFAGTASNDASILPPILNPNAFAGPVVESSLDEFSMHTAGRALAFSMFLHDYALRPAPVNDEPKTYAEVIAEMVVGSAANIEAVREMAERTRHPLLLDAFREPGYKVQRRHDAGQDRQERKQRRPFGQTALDLLDRSASQPLELEPSNFEQRYVAKLIERAASGDFRAAKELADLTEGTAEWLIEKK
jgi:hypothetical protein